MLPSFDKIGKFIHSIPETVCGGMQPEALYRLSWQTRGEGEVVEIGTFVGKSTIALAYGQKVKGGRPVTSIDVHEHPDIQRNLEEAGVSDFVHRVVSPSHLVARQWSRPVELLWIDGDHSYAGICQDIKSWLPHLIAGGVVAFHDYPGHLQSDHVWKALKKYVFRHPDSYRVVSDREAGSIIAFQKLPVRDERRNLAGKVRNRLFWSYRSLRFRVKKYLPDIRLPSPLRKVKNRVLKY